MEFFSWVLIDQINPLVTKIWGSIVFWRYFSLVLLVFIILLMVFKESFMRLFLQEDRKKHDKEIFQLLDLILPEVKLIEALHDLEKKCLYQKSFSDYIDKFIDAAHKDSRQYLDAKLRKLNLLFTGSLENLREFIGVNFVEFSPPGSDVMSGPCLYPNPEIDGGGDKTKRDEKKYNEFIAELKKKVDLVQKNYKNFRQVTKNTLCI